MAYGILRQIFEPSISRKIISVQGEKNLPAAAPFIVATNHVGFMDGPAMVIYLFKRYRQTIYFPTHHFFWKLLGGRLAQRWLGMIPIRFERKKHALDEAIRIVRKGEIVGIFPEGTRNTNEHELLKGKTGAVRLALATGVPLIPIGIRNTTGYSGFEALKSFFKKKTNFSITIGQAVNLSEFHNKPIDKPLLTAATSKLMNSIAVLCGKEYPYY